MVASLFLVSGSAKLLMVAGTRAYMTAHGVPPILIWPTAAWEITAGVLLVLGLWIAVLLAGWRLLTAIIFHAAFGDPIMLTMFFKNIAMAGGFVLLARTGASVKAMNRLLSPQERARA